MDTSSTPSTSGRIVDALVGLMAEHGIEAVTVREVAKAAGVAIGTVQYHYPSRTELVAGAFAEVVARTRSRLEACELGSDPRANLVAVLSQLLPLDEPRAVEARVMVGFGAAAAHDPELARIQAELLRDIRAALVDGFTAVQGGHRGGPEPTVLATAALALVDGLALQSVSSGSAPDPSAEQVLEAFVNMCTHAVSAEPAPRVVTG